MKTWHRDLAAAAFVAALLSAMLFQTTPVRTAAAGGTTCESLSGLRLPNTLITAQVVAPGAPVDQPVQRAALVAPAGQA